MPLNQLSLDILNPVEISFEKTIAGLNIDVNKILDDTVSWPSNTILLYGDLKCGANILCEEYKLNSQHYLNLESDESIILEKLMHAELGEFKLILSFEGDLKSKEFQSADLSSRIKNIYKIKLKEPTTEFLKIALKSNLLANGLKFSTENIGIIISKLPKTFESVAKVQNFLLKTQIGNRKLTKSMLEAIIDEFINTNLNGDLFNERNR